MNKKLVILLYIKYNIIYYIFRVLESTLIAIFVGFVFYGRRISSKFWIRWPLC